VQRLWQALALGSALLAACNGGGPSGTQVQVQLVNGLSEPINATAAAYRVGNGPFQPLNPSGLGIYTFTVPAGQDRYTVVFRCPTFGTLSSQQVQAVSYELTLQEATSFKVRCYGGYAGPEANLNQPDDNTSSRDFSGGYATAYSATTMASLSDEGTDGSINDIDNAFRVPVGQNREVAIFGEVGGTYYFGRGFFNITPTTTGIPPINVSPVSATFTTSSPAQANLLGREVNIFLGTGSSFPKPSSLSSDLYQVLTFSGSSAALKRIPAPNLPSTVNISAPSLTFTPTVPTPAPGDLPTFQALSASGFSGGIDLRGYLLVLSWPTGSSWQHFVSQGALGGTNYALPDPTSIAGLSALKPASGDPVNWQAVALGVDQPLGHLLAADPIPQGFGFDLVDRGTALELEAESAGGSYTQP